MQSPACCRDTATQSDLLILKAVFKKLGMFERVSQLLTLFQLNSRAKECFIRAALLATGSISSAAAQTNLSIRGSESTA